jgi:hypothetical protein
MGDRNICKKNNCKNDIFIYKIETDSYNKGQTYYSNYCKDHSCDVQFVRCDSRGDPNDLICLFYRNNKFEKCKLHTCKYFNCRQSVAHLEFYCTEHNSDRYCQFVLEMHNRCTCKINNTDVYDYNDHEYTCRGGFETCDNEIKYGKYCREHMCLVQNCFKRMEYRHMTKCKKHINKNIII